MHFDRFDICAAWYLYLSHTHEGQGSAKYARLCKLMGYYTPPCCVCALSENARAIYEALMEGDG